MSKWQTRRLGDVADTQLGKMLNKSTQKGDATIPYLRNVNVQWGEIKLDDLNEMDIYVEERDKFTALPGDLLVCEGGEVGRCAIWEGPEPIGIQNAIHRIRTSPELSVHYLRHYLEFMASNGVLEGIASGVTIKHLTQEKLRNLEISFPTIEKQHQIVERIESTLANVRKCQSEIAETRRKQEDLRRKLFQESFVGGPFLEVGTHSRETAIKTLGEIANWGSGGTPSTKIPANYVGDIPWAVIGDLTESKVIRTEKSISEGALKRSSAKIFPKGSVMIAMYGASIGRTGIAGIDMATNQAIAVAQPKPSLVREDYLLYFLQSQREAFVAAGQGGAQPNISQQVIKSWRITLPSLSEQLRVVQELDSQFARLASASETLRQLNFQIANLKAAVLTSSFTQKSAGEI
jgi:type I restriction enzyme S subunit